jgi:hypothetical protein
VAKFITRPASLTVVRVVEKFELLDSNLGPISLIPGDLVLRNDATADLVGVRRADALATYLPIDDEAAALLEWPPSNNPPPSPPSPPLAVLLVPADVDPEVLARALGVVVPAPPQRPDPVKDLARQLLDGTGHPNLVDYALELPPPPPTGGRSYFRDQVNATPLFPRADPTWQTASEDLERAFDWGQPNPPTFDDLIGSPPRPDEPADDDVLRLQPQHEDASPAGDGRPAVEHQDLGGSDGPHTSTRPFDPVAEDLELHRLEGEGGPAREAA